MSSIQFFQWSSILGFVIALILLLTVWRKKPYYTWTLLSLTLIFPFEWFGDYVWLIVDYDKEFLRLGSFPLPVTILFAYATFYAVSIFMYRRTIRRSVGQASKLGGRADVLSETKLASEMLRGNISEGDTVKVRYDRNSGTIAFESFQKESAHATRSRSAIAAKNVSQA